MSRVGCPDPKCVKEAREASEEEVRRVVTEEEVQRWKWLRQKRLFEKGISKTQSVDNARTTYTAFYSRSHYGPLSRPILPEPST